MFQGQDIKCYCGFYREYYSNGKIKINGQYHKLTESERKKRKIGIADFDCVNEKCGKWVYYDNKGYIIKTEEYKFGELVK